MVTVGEKYEVGGRRRRDYTLTAAGRVLLQQELEQMARAARTVIKRLGVTKGAARVIRELIGAAVLRSYPDETRAERGEEMLGTRLDAGDRSRTAFVREGTLVHADARERARAAAKISTGELVRDSLLWAAMLWMAVNLARISGAVLRDPQSIQGVALWMLLLWPVSRVLVAAL